VASSRSVDREERQGPQETQTLRDARVAAKEIDITNVVSDLTWRLADAALAAVYRDDASPAAISVKVSRSHLPGRAVLWVSANVPAGVASKRVRPADAIELELDAALVKRHRLLASEAHPIAAGSVAVRLGAPTAPAAPGVERVTALYEIEVHGIEVVDEIEVHEIESGAVLDDDMVLGTVRVRNGGPATAKPQSFSRSFPVGWLTEDWSTQSRAAKLAVLGAEIATLPNGVSPDVIASLRDELERLRAEADGRDAQRAAELLAALPRSVLPR
jgi:hypothetical protein